MDHHEAHALLGFHTSPFRAPLVISYDGGGNDGFFNVYMVAQKSMHRIARLDYNMGQSYTFLASLLPDVTGKSNEAEQARIPPYKRQ